MVGDDGCTAQCLSGSYNNTFLQLLEILTDESHSEVISWLPHGNGFVIHKKKTFASDVLPNHFKASKFTSFTRKLNRWGFTRVPRGPETGAYFHKMFRRDKPDLCMQMTSNSGNKYQSAHLSHPNGGPMQPQLLPNVPGAAAMMMGGNMNMGVPGNAAGTSGGPVGMPMFPYMAPPMLANMTPQQQQAMWQQQMQMIQMQQQMQLTLMQQQQQQQQQQQHQQQH